MKDLAANSTRALTDARFQALPDSVIAIVVVLRLKTVDSFSDTVAGLVVLIIGGVVAIEGVGYDFISESVEFIVAILSFRFKMKVIHKF